MAPEANVCNYSQRSSFSSHSEGRFFLGNEVRMLDKVSTDSQGCPQCEYNALQSLPCLEQLPDIAPLLEYVAF